MRVFVGLCLIGVWAGLAFSELPEPELVWDYEAGGALVGTPVLYPCVDAPTGVVTLTQDGHAVMVDGKGQFVWDLDLGSRTDATPAVGDLDGDGVAELVTATLDGELIVLNTDGSERWRYPLHGKVTDWSAACLPDLDGDGKCEIVIGDQDGWLNCIDGEGNRLWHVTVDAYQVSPPGFVKGTGGRADRIIFGTENDHMAAVDASGQLAWVSRHVGQFGRTNPTAGDLDGDGDYEVTFITSFNNPDSRVWALDAYDGSLAWSAKVNLHGYVANAIADVDGDGRNEVVTPLRSNTIYCFDGNGTQRWQTLTGGNAFCWTPAIADIDGDGRREVVAGVRSTNERGKSWFVLNDQGDILAEYAIPGGACGAILVADVDGDGRLEVVVPGTDKGLLRCVTFGGEAEGARRPWVSHRYDAARLGCVPAEGTPPPVPEAGAPAALAAAWEGTPQWGVNQLEVAWPTVSDSRVVVEVSSTDAFGRRTTRVQDLAVEELPATLPVGLVGEGRHVVDVRLWDPADWTQALCAWHGEVDLAGFETFADSVSADLDGLSVAADGLMAQAADAARMLGERQAQRLGALDALANRAVAVPLDYAPNADALLAEIERFRHAVREDMALARIAEAANETQPGIGIAAWEDPNPWDLMPALLEAPADAGYTPLAVRVPLYRGEYESRALDIVNLGSNPTSVQVRVPEESRDALLLYEVIDTLGRDGDWLPDALAELNTASTLRIAPGEARRLWVSVNGKVLEAGTTELPFELCALNASEDRLPVKVVAEVSSLDLRDAPMFRVCNWSSPSRIRGSVDMSALHTAREHGMNVFCGGAPTPRCDKDGRFLEPVDWTQFDTDLELMGDDGFLLISGGGVAPPEGFERFGAEHVTAQRAWLQALAAHLQSKGWGRDRWAMYPVDEPGLYGGTRIREFEEIARHLREADPEAPIYANPSGFVTTENMAGMVPLVDVWCPEQGVLRRQPELAPFFLSTGKPVWCYEAPPDAKIQLPLGYFRANGWMAFQLGLSGTGFWTQFYTGAYYGGNDMWHVGQGTLYGANYVVSGKEVISRRWEAFRDGIEDVRAFMILRDATEKAKAASRGAAQVKRAEELLTHDVVQATRKAWPCGDPTRFLRDYEMDYEDIQRIRQEVAELTSALQAE